ncbi:hypothetical protein AX16_007822 [Volvariella volvacea WC 439]|nr:hypothetical protein AX16_007822 [Volvariella volvacea WC 439]
MKIHDASAKRYQCLWPYCTFSSLQKGGLQVHYNKHTDERPYRCAFCFYSSADPASITRHHRIRHNYSLTASHSDVRNIERENVDWESLLNRTWNKVPIPPTLQNWFDIADYRYESKSPTAPPSLDLYAFESGDIQYDAEDEDTDAEPSQFPPPSVVSRTLTRSSLASNSVSSLASMMAPLYVADSHPVQETRYAVEPNAAAEPFKADKRSQRIAKIPAASTNQPVRLTPEEFLKTKTRKQNLTGLDLLYYAAQYLGDISDSDDDQEQRTKDGCKED